MKIGGNITALLQVKDNGTKNSIGEREHVWYDVTALKGWLDLSNGTSDYLNFNAKLQDSTHVFMCDFTNLKGLYGEWVWNPFNLVNGIVNQNKTGTKIDVTSENARMVIRDNVYQILLIDNPMEMNYHLEIYLKYIGSGLGVN